jgi:tetratricopeptide (TPR) repeat protein
MAPFGLLSKTSLCLDVLLISREIYMSVNDPATRPRAAAQISHAPPEKQLQRKLTEFFNLYGEECDKPHPDPETLAAIEAEVFPLLDHFEETEANEHENPGWVKSTMRSGWAAAREDWQESYDHDLVAYPLASEVGDARRAAQTCRGLSVDCYKLGRYDESRRWAEQALVHDPDRVAGWTSLVVPYAKTGDAERADRLLGGLIDRAEWGDPHDELAARLRFDADLHELEIESSARLRDLVRARFGA